MKSLLRVVALLALVSCGGTANYVGHDPEVIDAQIVGVSVQIINIDGSCGSGTVIEQNQNSAYVLTANHVPDEDPSLIRIKVGREWIDGELTDIYQMAFAYAVFRDPANDLCILRTDPIFPACANLLTVEDYRNLRLNMEVFVYGFPLGLEDGTLTSGFICDLDDRKMLRISAPIYFGNSGGGIFVRLGNRFVLISVACAGYVGNSGAIIPHMALGADPHAVLHALQNFPRK